MLCTMQEVHLSGVYVSETAFLKALGRLPDHGSSIPLNIRAQNAGILISKMKDCIRFDAFELSPKNEAAMSTKGRLRREFPGASVTMSASDFQQTGFQAAITQTLSNMSNHAVAGLQPQAWKAGRAHDEDRDTTHPGIVSELFIGFLLSIGEPAPVPNISKNTRDEVLWDNTRSPWRRSPTWLLIRVALQLTFTRAGASDVYKQAMAFIMAYVLQRAPKHSLPTDILYAMNAKLARRLLKIGSRINHSALTFIQSTMKDTYNTISKSWSVIRKQNSRTLELSKLGSLDFQRDTHISLPTLDEYIDAMGHRKADVSSTNFVPTSGLVELQPDNLPCLQTAGFQDDAFVVVNLRVFERWVALHCRKWSQGHNGDPSTCGDLGTLLKDYHNLTQRHYGQNPEALSIMLLTVFELWRAIDDAAINRCSLLRDYDPGILPDVLQNLLLPFKQEMEQLRNIEDYINNRRSRARYLPAKLYISTDTYDCFAARYFESSPLHQNTLQRITSWAQQKKEEKVLEFDKLKQEYSRLVELHRVGTCEEIEVEVGDRYNSFKEMRHKSACKRCSYKAQAERISINIHEWPLPDNTTKAKVVVFELQIPVAFESWREATFYLLRTVLKTEYSSCTPARSSHSLLNDQHLASYRGALSSLRIGLLSEDKPHIITHRATKNMSTVCTADDVCLQSGLNYRYYDSTARGFVDNLVPTEVLPRLCTYTLPSQSSALQQYIYRPATSPDGPAPNAVIANQSDCPGHMSLEEYKDLSHIALGHRIQWHNVLLQLAAPSVDFGKHETVLVIYQSLYQAGPGDSKDSALRDAHALVTDANFSNTLLDTLTKALQRVKENWESAQAVGLFSSIAARLLSLNSSPQVHQRCLDFLTTLCNVALGWVELLRSKAQHASDEKDREEFRCKSVEAALISAICFDVDDTHLNKMLSDPVKASIFIQCSIVVQEGKLNYSKSSEPVLSILSFRFRRLLYRTYPILRERHGALDDAIHKSWPAYSPGSTWSKASDSTDHWLVTNTSPGDHGNTLRVHYNLLSGELLVNGLPLGRPPERYEKHPMWPKLFGSSAVEVRPSPIPGMQFSARRQYHGHEVQIGLLAANDIYNTTEQDLVVRASTATNTYETVPARVLRRQFPDFFINEFVHWYNHSNGTIELRPVNRPWERSAEPNWTLIKCKTNSTWRLMKDGDAVFGSTSRSATVIADILSPFSDAYHIHVVLQSSGKSVEVDIPSIQLGFLLDLGVSSLHSREYRGMMVDADQSLDTLVGFSNKLVLKSEGTKNRLVLLPEGLVTYQDSGGHVRVTVEKSSITKVHAVQEDRQLGRLVDDDSLPVQLFVAYLHALTSFCLPDPLTCKTGTEQALTILNSAAVRSVDQLPPTTVDILSRIGCLTPGRTFYPANEHVMQTVSWDSRLSFLSQHSGFFVAVTSIFQQEELQSTVYRPESIFQLPKLKNVDSHLRARDFIRSSTFRVSGYGAGKHISTHDTFYKARDKDQDSRRTLNAYSLSSFVHRREDSLIGRAPGVGHLWNAMSSTSEIEGPSIRPKPSTLTYQPTLVTSGFDFSLWPGLHLLLREQRARLNKFCFMLWLSAMASVSDSDLSVLQIVALSFTSEALSNIKVPMIPSCLPADGYQATKILVRQLVVGHLVPLREAPEASLRKKNDENKARFVARKSTLFTNNQNRAVEILTDLILRQWPCATLSTPDLSGQAVNVSAYIRADEAISKTRGKFKSWFDNLQFFEYLRDIEMAVRRLKTRHIAIPQLPVAVPATTLKLRGFVAASDLFTGLAPSLPRINSTIQQGGSVHLKFEDSIRLSNLIESLKKSSSGSRYETNYVDGLQNSLNSLEAQQGSQSPGEPSEQLVRDYLRQCANHVDMVYRALESKMTSDCTTTFKLPNLSMISEIEQWPRVSPMFFLEQLSRSAWARLNTDWKSCIVQYGIALAALQRAQRMVNAMESSNTEELMSEIENVGYVNWSPMDNPESLLLEVESGILIRKVQAQIAAEMRDPASGRNKVMQLNMGEGKSSVIIPMIAAALADTTQLVRVVVAKPQSKQMAQMLISKLGGLIGRRVYFMPFSRALKLDATTADKVGKIMQECKDNGGILLVQPEHILSFKLMVLDCYNSDRVRVGVSLLQTQDMFDKFSRDVIDEVDEHLMSVKFELIYTMGSQRPIELCPDRWMCIQQILELVRSFAPGIAKVSPSFLEIIDGREGSFARVRILKSEAGELLLSRIAKQICNVGLDGFPIARQPESVRNAVFTYMTKSKLTSDEIRRVEAVGPEGFWTAVSSKLLLLRGLLAGGVLAFALGQKRWRVNYGLVSTRIPPTALAVPYRAKDNPTPRSEFSHPDVVILLTSLSYYYGGLGDDELFTAFSHLMRSDQADIEYDAWIQDAPTTPSAFRQLEGINLRDRSQCVDDVFPHLKYGKSVIDYYLSHLVFPKEMKEFPHKLSASGWDLGKIKRCPTTGFSGTNDSRKLLPLDVDYLDLPAQKHTNALVLKYLLQPENAVVLMPSQHDTSTSDAERLLNVVMQLDPPVQVILDVGAQVLELDNHQVAETWLGMHTDRGMQAVVFVNEEDEVMVLNRKGRIERLQTSSFKAQLGRCLIFLDEAHTRGIDLKLPKYYRAAATLGARLTKDKLIQACMRMRKLGKGQAISFCVDEEIQTKIRECTSKLSNEALGVADVLHWAISETFADTRRSMPLWAVQGKRFLRQQELWDQSCVDGTTTISNDTAGKFLEDEAQSVHQRYRPHALPNSDFATPAESTGSRVIEITERMQEFDNLSTDSVTLQEEQERELSPEIEQEQQVEKPAPAQPLAHSLHPDLKSFVSSGVPVARSKAYIPAFMALLKTSGAAEFDVSQLTGDAHLLVTMDFARTVKLAGGTSFSDAYQRAVQWVLTSRSSTTGTVTYIMVISPFEAEQLMPKLQSAKNVVLHLYKPRFNKGHRSFDRLDFITVPTRTAPLNVPRSLLIQLDLFAGQLYLSSYDDYLEACRFLGLATTKSKGKEIVAADGLILRTSDGQDVQRSSPVKFLEALMSKIRRHGQGIRKTHLGDMLEGKILERSDFEE